MELSVLVVDDEPEMRSLVEMYLTSLSCKTIQAGDGREGLMALACQEVDAILTDLEMPHMDGEDFIKLARQQGFQGRILVITASLSQRLKDDLAPYGVVDFICKANPGNFRAGLQKFLELSKDNKASTECFKKVANF